MNRQFVYSGAIPQDTDLLSSEINAYVGISKLAAAVLGVSNVLNGFGCTPTIPASLNVIIAQGEMYSLQQIDTSAYSDLPVNANVILKQAVNLNTTTIPITPPSTSGYSQNYLIQFSFSEQDIDSAVLPYYNPTDPSVPYQGPNNNNVAQPTVRADVVNVTAKAGVAAPTGTQTTPAPDAGAIGGWVVTVTNAQTTITASNIVLYSSAGFINETLLQKISQTTADARYAQQTQIQNSQFTQATDTSLFVNTVTAALSPAISSYSKGLQTQILIANTNTGATTLSLNGITAANITYPNGGALIGGELVAGTFANVLFDGTNFELLNPARQIKRTVVTSSQTFTFQTSTSCIDVEISGGGGGSGGCVSVSSQYAASGGGGAGGYAKKLFKRSAIGNSQVITIGAAGTAGTAGNNTGGTGGTTTFGSLLTATGGAGGAGGVSSSSGGGFIGGAGGTATGGDINITGSNGFVGFALVTGTICVPGAGGSNQLSNVTPGVPLQNGAAPGINYGGGAGGTGNNGSSGTNFAGSAGAPGVCIITEYL